MLKTAGNLEQNLHAAIEKLGQEYVEFLKLLVRTPSPGGQEEACQNLIFEKMKELGIFDRRIVAAEYPDRPCIVGKLPGAGNHPFILNAHIDTAPVEDEGSWVHPPYSAFVEGEKLYGRGALDDKAGVAMMLLLAETFLKRAARFPGDIYFESVIGDEDIGKGTLACTDAGYRCEGGIIIDGTWPYRIVDSHLGQVWLQFEVKGVPAAACSHKRGINPVDLSFEIITRIRQVIRSENSAVRKWLNIKEPFFLNVGEIHGGAWPGAVPEKCSFQAQIGFPPPNTPEQFFEKVMEIVKEFRQERERCAVEVKQGSLFIPPFSNPENRISKIVEATVNRLGSGEMRAVSQAVTGHCDLRHLLRPDGAPADACLYGPGGGENPHVKNEYYRLDHFVPVAKNIASVILSWYNV